METEQSTHKFAENSGFMAYRCVRTASSRSPHTYAHTVYEKGAERVRMVRTLLDAQVNDSPLRLGGESAAVGTVRVLYR